MSKHLVVTHAPDACGMRRFEDFDKKCVKYRTDTLPLIAFLDERDDLLASIHERFIERIDVMED